ncbi:hypothetical protein BCEN4_660042 [Burkholderia cenocepacia]|nr:hypothetical protein BCEN4_660042 [Burkholderia cenocepacia]
MEGSAVLTIVVSSDCMKNAAATIQSSTECVGSRDMAKSEVRKARRVPDFERSMVPIPVVIGKWYHRAHRGHVRRRRFHRPRTEIERLSAAHQLIGPVAWGACMPPTRCLRTHRYSPCLVTRDCVSASRAAGTRSHFCNAFSTYPSAHA